MEYNNIEHRIRIGHRIAELRKGKGITIVEMTEKTGLKKSTIWRVETGKFPPTLDTLTKIADVLGCRIEVVENN